MEKQYHLLIVDDEYHVVDWLAELFEEQDLLPLEVYKAYLAREALEILGKTKIDIVLSDIRMPGMDGFALADRITAEWPLAKIIFLTGYQEFEYAYKANQYKNIMFLLKTEDDDVILNAVKKAVELLEEENRQRELQRNYADMQQVMTWQMEKSILSEWLKRGNIEADKGDFVFVPDKPMAVYCIRINDIKESILERERLAASLRQLLQEMLFRKGDIGIIDMEPGFFLAVVQSRTDKFLGVYLQEMLDEFSGAVLQSLKCHVFFSLYEDPVMSESVLEKYEILKAASEDVADTGDLYGGRVLGKKEEERLKKASGLLLSDGRVRMQLENLERFLEEGRRKEFFMVFDEIDKEISRVSVRHYYPAIEVYQRISVMYLSWINRKSLVEKLAFKTMLVKLMNQNDFENWREAFAYLRNLGKLLFQEQIEEQNNKNDVFLKNVKAFVRKNLQEPLSLTYISQQLHYNPSYISRLFKQLSGSNLSEYILEEKIMYARKRLEESEDTVAVIAKEIGFESSQYFSVVFRKQTGMSPGEYRHKKK